MELQISISLTPVLIPHICGSILVIGAFAAYVYARLFQHSA